MRRLSEAGLRGLKAASAKRADEPTSEPGNAIVEFVGVIVVLVVPALILLSIFITATSANFAISSAARDAARSFIRADSGMEAVASGESAANRAWNARGLDGDIAVDFQCSANPCLTPGESVRAEVTGTVTVPILGTKLTVSDSLTVTVDEFRRTRP